MMFRTLVLIALFFIGGSIPSGQARAGTVLFEFDLSTPTVTATEATFDISLLFSGDPGDQVKAYQLSVYGSDPLLTTSNSDFRRFGYTAASSPPPLNEWFSSGTMGGFPGPFGALELGFPFFPPIGPFIEPSASPLVLGTLAVDLTGIPAGTTLNVTLAGGLPDFSTDVGGTFDGQDVDSVASSDPDLITFSDPDGVTFQTPGGMAPIPEPSSVMIWGWFCFGLVWWVRKRKTLAFDRYPTQ